MKNKKGETYQPISPFLFIALAELLDFGNASDRQLAVGHLADDFELGAFILFALFERRLGQRNSLLIKLCVLTAGVDTKPALETAFH